MLGVVLEDEGDTYEMAETTQVIAPDEGGVTHWEGQVRLEVPASSEPGEFRPRSAGYFDVDEQDYWYALADGVEAKALVDDAGEMMGWLAAGTSRIALVLDVTGDGMVDYYEETSASFDKRYLLNETGRQIATSIRTHSWSMQCQGGGVAFTPEPAASIKLSCGSFAGAAASVVDTFTSDAGSIAMPASYDTAQRFLTQGDLVPLPPDLEAELHSPPARDYGCANGPAGQAEEDEDGFELSDEQRAELDQFREDWERYGLDTVFYGAWITDFFPIKIPNPFDGDGLLSRPLAYTWEKLGERIKEEIKDRVADRDDRLRILGRSMDDVERLLRWHAQDRIDEIFSDDEDWPQPCPEPERDGATGDRDLSERATAQEASAKGDPHLRTLDGRTYGFQAAGEFVFMTSDALDVQLRFEGTVGRATWTQATAVRAGNHVIESYYDQSDPHEVPLHDGGLPVVVDGVETTVDYQGIELDDGTYLARVRGGVDDRQLLVVAADESVYVLVENLNFSQNVVIGVFEPLGTVSGLVGNGDGDRSNDLALRDGTVLSAAEARTVEGMYGRLATDWRVRPDERLFTRDRAEDFLTPAYTDLPQRYSGLADFPPEQVEQARSRCRMAGVLDPQALEDCAYDVLVGGVQWSRQAATSVTGQQPDLRAGGGQRTGDHPLFVAADRCRPDGVNEQLRSGVHPDLARQRDGATALLFAAQGGCVEVVDRLLAAGANVELTNDRNVTPLEMAASRGRQEVVRMLLAAGADPNRFDRGRDGPLVAAAFGGHTEVAAALVRAGAYVDITRDRDGATPLLAATYEGHADLVEMLLQQGADPALPDDRGQSPLMAAASQGHADLVRHLATAGAPLEQRRFRDGATALHFAASNGHTGAVRALLDAGADPTVEDDRGRTPADVAHDRVADLL